MADLHDAFSIKQSTYVEVASAIMRAGLLQIIFRQLIRNIIRLTDRQAHNRQRWVFARARSELTAVRDKQVRNIMALAPFVHDPIFRQKAHAIGA